MKAARFLSGAVIGLLLAGCGGLVAEQPCLPQPRLPQPAGIAPEARPGRYFIFPLIMIHVSPLVTPTPAPEPLPAPRGAGVAWPKEDARERAADLAAIGARLTFDWGMSPDRARATWAVGVAYLPMQWSCRQGAASVDVARVQAFAREFPGSWWLAFNEPDHPGQANCTPEAGARAYRLLEATIRAADPAARILCCGTAFYPGHIDWLTAWATEYRALYGAWPSVDGIHLHSYGQFPDRLDAPRRKHELEQVYLWSAAQPWAVGKPFLISEWAVSTASWWGWKDAGPIADYYIPTMRAWFDAQPWIVGDIWFSSWYSAGMYEPDNIWESGSAVLTRTGRAWRAAAR